MSAGKNIILKTVLDVHYNGSRDSIALQHEVGEWCRNDLAKALGEQFDRLETPGIVVKIDSLDIDVNINDQQNWLHAVLPEITRQLVEKSSDAVQKQVGVQQNLLRAFFHFLEHGTLPWWSSVQVQRELLEGLAQTNFDANEKNEFSKLLGQAQVRERVALLPDRSFLKLLGSTVPNVETIWRELEGNILANESGTAVARLRKVLKASILDHFDDVDPERQAQNIVSTFTNRAENLGRRGANAAHNQQTNLQSLSKPNVPSPSRIDPINAGTDAVDTDGLYIGDAGLIIVAPFLTTLFVKLDLINNNTITDIDKAVSLVHYLATGSEVFGEFEVGLAKILCGVEMKTVIDTGVVLDDFCKEEANNLLQSVVEHWSILKNTSVAGLQESFLQRNGKLLFKEHEWNLQVEQRPYDMLLQNLPWNISMIKLSWMPHLLRTEWVF